MSRLTLSEAKGTIARVLGKCDTSSAVADYINEATRRLLYEGKWVGTYAKYQICTTGNESDSIITWPRFIETIESVAINERPAVIRNEWYEFLESGPWLLNSERNIGNTLVDRGESCVTSDIIKTGNAKKIKVTSAVTETGKRILLQGFDWTGSRIRTLDSSTYVDGEYVTIGTAGAISTNEFSFIESVQKPVTNGFVRLYEYDTVTTTERQIALYAYDETLPSYRRSIIPGLQNFSTCTDCESETPSVEVRAKLRFIPVRNDTDYILIGNLPALKLAVMAIKKEESDLIGEATAYMYGGRLPDGSYAIGAVPLLQKELQHWLGDGAVPVVRLQDRSIFGAGGIANVIS